MKVEFNGEIRRVALKEQSLEFLETKMKNMFPQLMEPFLMKYRNEVGELVSLNSEDDLAVAISLVKNNSPPLLRLTIIENEMRKIPSPIVEEVKTDLEVTFGGQYCHICKVKLDIVRFKCINCLHYGKYLSISFYVLLIVFPWLEC